MGALGARLARWMYPGGRPNRLVCGVNRVWAAVFARGLLASPTLITLEVESGAGEKPAVLPLTMADVDGERYLVSMFGEKSGWVRRVRAADGRAVVCQGDRRPVTLVDVPVTERAPILRGYLDQAPGARAHFPVPRSAAVAEFARVAPDYPVFRVVDRAG